MAASSPGQTARRERNRRAIVDAAVALLLERGAATVSLEDIAAAAELSPRTLFNHFATRDTLMVAIAEDRASFLASAIEALPARSNPPAVLETLGELIVETAERSGPHYREFVGEMNRYNATGEITRTGHLGDAFQRVASDVDGLSTEQSAALGDLMVGAVLVAVANYVDDPSFDLTGALRAAGELLSGIAAGSTPGGTA